VENFNASQYIPLKSMPFGNGVKVTKSYEGFPSQVVGGTSVTKKKIIPKKKEVEYTDSISTMYSSDEDFISIGRKKYY
jgi:hypothetical protein